MVLGHETVQPAAVGIDCHLIRVSRIEAVATAPGLPVVAPERLISHYKIG